ncbi:MAG: nucleoside hydrolase [Succinivibrio sp.]
MKGGESRKARASKVLLDSDMVDWLDDGAAMMMLAKDPSTELVGVTTCIGNTWVEAGTASALRQLEAIGDDSVPVLMGVNSTTRKGRFDGMPEEIRRFGSAAGMYLGAAAAPKPQSWEQAYRQSYGGEPKFRPGSEFAPDFIARTLEENPGEVTVIAIGSGANLAEALRRRPSCAALARRVVCMAGAFFVPGNVMPCAEFNSWIDPEAMRAVFRAPFPELVVVPLDATNGVRITKERWQKMKSLVANPVIRGLIERHWMSPFFEKGEVPGENCVWDLIAAAYAIDPAVMEREAFLPVDVVDQYGPAYGQTIAYTGQGPEGSRRARIMLKADADRVWEMIYRMCRAV